MTTLVTARFDEAELARLGPVRRAGYGVTGRVLPPEELAALLEDVDVLVVEFEHVTGSVLAAVRACASSAAAATSPAQASTSPL